MTRQLDDDGEVRDWSKWATIKRCNPLVGFNPHLAPKLRSELAKAKRDDDARRQFQTFRLNRPAGDLTRDLVTPGQWAAVLKRTPPPREGPAIRGDRHWLDALLVGRDDDVAQREGGGVRQCARHSRPCHTRETGQPAAWAACSVSLTAGVVAVAKGLHTASPDVLLDLLPNWPIEGVVADRFHQGLLLDALNARDIYAVEWVLNQWSQASIDVAHFRAACLDGGLALDAAGHDLATLSLSQAEIDSDTSGNVKLRKAHRQRRDDVAQSLVLAVSAAQRWPTPQPFKVAAL